MEKVLSMKSRLTKSSNVDVISTKLRWNKSSASTCLVTGCVGLGSKGVQTFHVEQTFRIAIFFSKTNILFFKKIWELRKVPRGTIVKLFLQVQCEKPRLTMSYARRLSLFYQRIPSWDAVTKFVRRSKCQTCWCKNGIGDLTHRFCVHALDMHWQRGRNPRHLIQKIQNVCIFR